MPIIYFLTHAQSVLLLVPVNACVHRISSVYDTLRNLGRMEAFTLSYRVVLFFNTCTNTEFFWVSKASWTCESSSISEDNRIETSWRWVSIFSVRGSFKVFFPSYESFCPTFSLIKKATTSSPLWKLETHMSFVHALKNSIFRYKRPKRAVRAMQVWKCSTNPRPRLPSRGWG